MCFFHSGLSLTLPLNLAYTQLSSMRFNGQCVAQCSNVWIETQAFLNTNMYNKHNIAEDTAQKWLQCVASTGRCSLHSPRRKSADVNHCSSSRTLPAHPLLRMNGYGTDRRGKMLLRRCVNNPGWIERCLFSLAYFSQVRDEKKGMRGAKRHSVHSMTPDSARLLKGWYQTKCV